MSNEVAIVRLKAQLQEKNVLVHGAGLLSAVYNTSDVKPFMMFDLLHCTLKYSILFRIQMG